MDTQLKEIREKFAQLEAGLSERDTLFMLSELKALLSQIDGDLQEYIDKMKALGIRQSLRARAAGQTT